MTNPSSFPWVNYKMFPTAGVESTPIPVFGSDSSTCVLSSINVCNTSLTDIYVYFYILRVDVGNFFFKYNHLINQNTSQDILNVTTLNGFGVPYTSELTLESGDLLYAYTDSSSSTCDISISYSELLESALFLTSLQKEKRENQKEKIVELLKERKG